MVGPTRESYFALNDPAIRASAATTLDFVMQTPA
jgi:hypothetical protein